MKLGLDACVAAAFQCRMGALAVASVVLALATLYALADSDLGAAAFYTLAAFLGVFLGYCCSSIEKLRRQLASLERSLAARREIPPP